MRAISVQDAGGVGWTVQVQWRPRFPGLVRRIGGWRDRDRHPDVSVVDVYDLAWPKAPEGWTYRPAPTGTGATGATGRGGGGGWLSDVDVDGPEALVGLVVLVLASAVVLLAVWFVVLPLALLVLDLVLVVVLFVAGTLGRVLFRRPWTVIARSARGDIGAKKVVGWRAALRARDDIVEAIRNGVVRAEARA